MRELLWLLAIIAIDICFLLYGLSGLSISYYEADILINQKTPLHYLVKFSCDIFGYNDFGLRVPFLVMHVMNILLIYFISKSILKKPHDSLLVVVVFILLPGINASALVVNEASTAILFTLLFVWCWQKEFFLHAYLLLVVALGIDNSFVILYLSLFFYAIMKKENLLLILSLLLFSLGMYLYGFDSGGKPKGYFLDTMGVYSAVLSPFLFLYYIYTLYRIAIKEDKHILWYISFGSFVFTLIFSLRQRLMLEDFLPFAIIAIPLMVKVFLNSYRVRLPKFRKLHKIISVFVLSTLFISFLLIVTNKVLYLVGDNPQKHFAYKHNVAKELSSWLLDKNVSKVHVDNERLALRLRFYGIENGMDYKLIEIFSDKSAKDIFTLKFGLKTIVKYKLVKYK